MRKENRKSEKEAASGIMLKRKIFTFIFIFLLTFAAFPLNASGYEMITLASGQNGPYDVAVDESYLYFLEYDGATVKKVPSGGGSVVTLASGLIQPTEISIDSSDVYFIDCLYTGAGYIKKVSKSGGSVATLLSGLYSPVYLSVDSNYVYFSDSSSSKPITGYIGRVPKTGGTVSTLASGLNDPQGVAVDASFVYFAELYGGYIKRVPIDGGAVQTLVSGLNGPKEVALDLDYAYFSEYGAGYVKRVVKSGGTPQILASGPALRIIDIALDSTHLYYTEPGDGNVKMVPKNGGLVETIASGQNYPIGLTTDSTSVYFAEYTSGNVKKIVTAHTQIAFSQMSFQVLPKTRVVGTLNTPFGGVNYKEAIDYMHSVWTTDTLIQQSFGYLPLSLTISNLGPSAAANVEVEVTLTGTVWFTNAFLGLKLDPYDPATVLGQPKRYSFGYSENLAIGGIPAEGSVSVNYDFPIKYATVVTLWIPQAWCFVALDDAYLTVRAYGSNTNEAISYGPPEGIHAIDFFSFEKRVVTMVASKLIELKFFPSSDLLPGKFRNLILKQGLQFYINVASDFIAQGITQVTKWLIGPNGKLTASLSWQGSSLVLKGVSPSRIEFIGEVHNSTSVMSINAAEAGEWTFEVFGENVTGTQEEYALGLSIGKMVNATQYVPYDYPTIQEAINSAVSGDTIFVGPGTYNESLVVDKPLSLIGASRNITIIDGEGIFRVVFVNAHNTTIEGFTIQHGERGIEVQSSNNTISANTIKNNLGGIFLYQSSDNFICGNTILQNSEWGVWLFESFNNTISQNNITQNGFEAPVPENGGVILLSSSSNTIYGNTITQNWMSGVCLSTFGPNTLLGNTIANNVDWGIYLEAGTKNQVAFHNNFINNPVQVFSMTPETLNEWDYGYPSGGNYWSDYTREDLYRGPYQNVTGSDGIGDTPYGIDMNNQDNYPLMSPSEYWSNPIPSDINKDMKVDNKDLSQLAAAYGSTTPSGNPNCDINGDGKVDITDLFDLSKNYGKTYP